MFRDVPGGKEYFRKPSSPLKKNCGGSILIFVRNIVVMPEKPKSSPTFSKS